MSPQRRIHCALLLLFGNIAWNAFADAPKTLEECYAASLRRSEDIATQVELVNQAEERYRQAIGSILPNISGSTTYQTQAQSANSTASGFSPANQTTVKLTATQPIFQGFREFAGLHQTVNLLDSQVYTRNGAMVMLYQNVATSFYTVLLYERDLVNLRNEIGANEKRVKELQARVRIGRSRIAEVLTVQTTVANLQATVEQTIGLIAANRDALAFLTGSDRNITLLDAETVPLKPESVDSYLSQIPARPDVSSAKKSLDAADNGVGVARGAHLPSIDFTGDYYFVRPGFFSDVNWDVMFTATIPIFAGGTIQSQVRAAESQREQAYLALSRAQRAAEQEIRQDYDSFNSDQSQVDRLAYATELAFKNYQAEVHDYRFGLVTNLDVLQAITSWQESQRSLDRTRYTAKLDFAKLESAVARRPKLPAPD